MSTLSYSQLEGEWDQAGGNPQMAPTMAAIAEVESSGRPTATNPSGATGLWQIEWPLHAGIVPDATSQGALENPLTNAQAAVALAAQDPSTAPGSPVYDNWLEWEPAGAYLQYLNPNAQASTLNITNPGGSPALNPNLTPNPGSNFNQQDQLPSAISGIASALNPSNWLKVGLAVGGVLIGALLVSGGVWKAANPNKSARAEFGKNLGRAADAATLAAA